MQTYTDSRLINISSDSADIINNGQLLSSCIFNFPGMLKEEEDILYTQISVANAQIPISYYIINEYNNVLKYKIGSGSTLTATFTMGNYNANSFATEFKAQIPSFTLTLNKVNGKFTFSNASSFTFYYSGSTVLKTLGLNINSNVVSSGTYTAPYPCQFQGITRIKIISDMLSTYSMDSISGNFSNNLQTISVNSGSYGILLFENSQMFKGLLRNQRLDYFDIGIVDDNENYIDFNNIGWHMTLQLDITRRLPDTNKTMILQPQQINYTDVQQEEPPQDEPPQEQEQNIEPLPETTGDTDLDLLMYNQGIY